MSITEFAKQMLDCLLSSKAVPQELLEALQNSDYFFCIAKRGTTYEEWNSKHFEAFIDNKALIVFLSLEEAQRFAKHWNCVINNEPMVNRVSKESLRRIIAEYTGNAFIDSIKIYSIPPICLSYPSSACLMEALPSASTILHDERQSEYLGVEQMREILDTYEVNARKKLDPGQRAENIHTLVQSLVQQNKLEYEELDKTLDMPQGYTREFCLSANGTHPSMEVLEKYLSFFGLQEYLYIYKKDCIELTKYINSYNELDKYELTSRIKPSDERFCLKKLIRGTDSGGHYVYKVILENADRKMSFVISDPLNKVVGREYGVVGIEKKNKDAISAPDLNEDALSELSKSMDAQPEEKRERTYEEIRKDEILFYFKRRNMNMKSAEAKYRELETEPDILDEFYKYVSKKEFGKLEIAGYTGRKLIREMHMDPYEAFLSMVQLRTDPQNTKQRLKYRETDPQYQRSKSSNESN